MTVAPAVAPAGRIDATEAQLREAAAQLEIARVLSSTLELEPLLKIVAQQAARACDMDRCSVYMHRGERLVGVMSQFADGHVDRELWRMFRALEGFAVEQIPFVEDAVRTRAPVVISDPANDPRVPAAMKVFKAKGSLILPLLRAEKLIGVLVLENTERDGPVRPEQVRLGMMLGSQITLALENASLYESSREQARELEVLGEIRKRLGSSLDLTEVLNLIADSALRLMGTDRCVVFELDEREQLLYPRAARNLDLSVMIPLGVGIGATGTSVLKRQAVWSADVERDGVPGFDHSRPGQPTLRHVGGALGVRAVLALPLLSKDRAVGAICVIWTRVHAPQPREIRLLEALAESAAIAVDNAQLYKEARLRLRHTTTLLEIAHALGSTLELTPLLKEIAQRTAVALGVDRCSVYLLQEDGLLRPVMSQYADGHADVEQWRKSTAERWTFTAAVLDAIRGGAPVLLNEPETSPLLDPAWVETFGIKNILYVPLFRNSRVIGALSLANVDTRRPIVQDQVSLATTIASEVALVIDNARLHAQTQAQLRQARAQVEIARVLDSSLPLSKLLAAIARQAAQACEMDRCSIYLWKDERVVPVMSQFAAERNEPELWKAFLNLGQMRVDEVPFFSEILRRRGPVVVTDPPTDPLVPRTMDIFKLTAFVAVPLVRQEKVVGALVLDNTERRGAPTEAQVALATTIASQVALAINNASLYQAAQARAAELEILNETGKALVSNLDLPGVLQALAQSAARLVRVERSAVFELDPTDQRLHARATHGMRDDDLFPPIRLGRGAAGSAAMSREPVFSPDVGTIALPGYDELWEEAGAPLREVVERRGYRAVLGVPIVTQERVVGAFCVYWERVHMPTSAEIRLLTALAQQAAVAIENARLYQATARALAEVEAKNGELDSFVYSVSHDLKSPLVTIEGMTGALLEDYGPQVDAKGRRYLERLRANAAQMERLIQDLLALARIGREARPAEAVNVAELVDDLRREMDGLIKARDAEVVVRDAGMLGGVRTEIEQVFRNLISNAIKYARESVPPLVEIGMADGGATVECYVKDNGVGMDPAYHTKVFEMFQRLKEVEAEGTGVGLPIVKKIVEMAGGRIWLESAKGHGTTVRFTWPKG